MFEAAISPAVAAPGASGTLRVLDWNELVARLAATRDLRALFDRSVGPSGSFAAQAQRGLARDAAGQPAVNQDALGHRKTPPAISIATVEEAAEGDQGTR